MPRWSAGDARATRVQQHATAGQWSLLVELPAGQQYSGISLIEPVAEWSTWQELVMDIFLADDVPLKVTVKIQDAEHDNDYYDRFNRVIRLSPGPNEVRILLSDVATAPRTRSMDMRGISSLTLFAVSPEQTRTIFVDNIRLR